MDARFSSVNFAERIRFLTWFCRMKMAPQKLCAEASKSSRQGHGGPHGVPGQGCEAVHRQTSQPGRLRLPPCPLPAAAPHGFPVKAGMPLAARPTLSKYCCSSYKWTC
jgi:hypothetical protein